MAANQPPWPREWLMTDERLGEKLWQAIDAMPGGAGIVFRHYATPPDERLRLGQRVAATASDRRLTLAVAGSRLLATELGAALLHNPDSPGGLPCSKAVHDEAQARAAKNIGAVLAFIAPMFPTRSHPGVRLLEPGRAAVLARMAGCPAIALGGMNARRFGELDAAMPGAFHGYAGIDCWLNDEEVRT
jgi:thiamine-phosphate pyrophosphorylase